MRKTIAVFLLSGLLASLYAIPNARYYALGQADFVGDILVSAAQPWQILGYADQIQASADLTPAGQRPGPLFLIKSLGDNAAIGLAANIFDKRTKGSVFFSPYYTRSTNFAKLYDTDQREFPSYPQLNIAYNLGGQKLGLNFFYQTETFNNDRTTPASSRAYQRSERDGSIFIGGGCLSARFGFGNLGWNPWVRFGVPGMQSTDKAKIVAYDSTTNLTTETNQTETYQMASSGAGNLMYNAGSCFDYTFGDWGWGIIGAWYRSEQYKFMKTSTATTYSPKYVSDYYDYFASFTPHIFGDLLMGIEYQGAYYATSTRYEDLPKNDTSDMRWYNEFIIAMEKPIKVSTRWLDVFTPRGSVAFSAGRALNRTEIAITGSPNLIDVTNTWTPIRTVNYDDRDGFLMYLGFGLTKGRCTMDICTDLFAWGKLNGIATLPPPLYFTMTVDMH